MQKIFAPQLGLTVVQEAVTPAATSIRMPQMDNNRREASAGVVLVVGTALVVVEHEACCI